jgi:hypothetical protein
MKTCSKFTAVALLGVALAVSGCAEMTNQQQRALSGGSIGAVGGAAIGALTGGSIVTGALIGAGGGAAVGALLPDGWNKKPTRKESSR